MIKCNQCEYEYKTIGASIVILHLCSDQEYHYVDRIDLIEEPYELIEEVEKKLKNKFNPSRYD